MEDIIFNSINELYIRVLPALKCKKKELTRNGFSYITEFDIWNSIRVQKWMKQSELALCDIVDDILNISNDKIVEYYKSINLKKTENEFELPKLKE